MVTTVSLISPASLAISNVHFEFVSRSCTNSQLSEEMDLIGNPPNRVFTKLILMAMKSNNNTFLLLRSPATRKKRIQKKFYCVQFRKHITLVWGERELIAKMGRPLSSVAYKTIDPKGNPSYFCTHPSKLNTSTSQADKDCKKVAAKLNWR
jgi:hypothetical protein